MDGAEEIEVFDAPAVTPWMGSFNKGFNGAGVEDFSDGASSFVSSALVFLILVVVNAVSSERIDMAEVVLVTSDDDGVFFSLKPVARDAQPLVFLTFEPLDIEEFELDIDKLLVVVVVSDVFESDGLGLKENRPVVTSVMELDIPFFTVDDAGSLPFDLLMDVDALLFPFVSLIDD